MTLQANWTAQYTTFQKRHNQFWLDFIQENLTNVDLLNQNKNNCFTSLKSVSKYNPALFIDCVLPYCDFLLKQGNVEHCQILLKDAQELRKNKQANKIDAMLHILLGGISYFKASYKNSWKSYQSAFQLANSCDLTVEKIKALIGLAQVRKIDDSKAAISYLNQGISLAQQEQDKSLLIEAGTILADIWVQSGLREEAKKLLLDILNKIPVNYESHALGLLFIGLGSVNGHGGDYQLSLEYFHKSLGIGKRLRNVSIQIISYSNIGTSADHLNQTEEAKKNYEASIYLAEKVGAIDLLPRLLQKYSILLMRIGDYDEGIKQTKRGLDYASRNSNKLNIHRLTFVLGALLIKKDSLFEAEEILIDGFNEFSSSDDQAVIINYLIQLGRLKNAQTDYLAAERFLKDAYNRINESQLYIWRCIVLISWGVAHLQLGNQKKARLIYLEAFDFGKQENDLWAIANSSLALAQMTFEEGNLDTAKQYLQQCLQSAKDHSEFAVNSIFEEAEAWGLEKGLI